MSFLQGFEHDCFISYRHLDDVGLDGMQGHGWVTRFYKAFEATLNQCLGQPSAVFLDPQLDGGSELAPALRQIGCASAVLVPIVSPGYLNSPKYCGEEVNSFREQAKLQGRWSVGNSVLAVRKVVIQPLENDYHNQYPVDEPGYWFFEIDPVTKKSRKFEVGSDGFLNRLSQLADDTAKFLTTLQAQRQSKSTSISVKDANATKKEILLACDASGFDGAEKVKLVSCVAVDQLDELSSRMARFKATLAIDRAFAANADLVDRVRRAGLRYENDEAPLRDRVADELAVLPWDGYVSFAEAAFWAQKSEADTILELLHGVLFDRLRGLPDTSIRLVLSPRLAPFWQSISQAASDYREQINSMDSVTVVGTSSIHVGVPKDSAVEIANYLGGVTVARLADPKDGIARSCFDRILSQQTQDPAGPAVGRPLFTSPPLAAGLERGSIVTAPRRRRSKGIRAACEAAAPLRSRRAQNEGSRSIRENRRAGAVLSIRG